VKPHFARDLGGIHCTFQDFAFPELEPATRSIPKNLRLKLLRFSSSVSAFSEEL
jgi:hypothetical protein